MAIRIITDSASDLELSDAKDWQVQVVPMSIQFGDRSYLDGLDLSKTEFYQKLLQGDESPTTAQPAPADFLQLFESARDAGDQVVVILLSSVLSACVTAFAGPVSFVGIAVPHLIKSLFRTAKPIVMIPACFLGGAVFCLGCDLIARTVFAPTELNISSVTAVFGAPVVIYLMASRKSGRVRG